LACDKENHPNIPYVYVNEMLFPNTLDFLNVSGYKYVNAGYRGIVVYRLSMDEFTVFERCCPYDPENPNARIIVDPNNLTATDTCCNSTFSLLDGIPVSGPSPYALLPYSHSYDGERLYINN